MNRPVGRQLALACAGLLLLAACGSQKVKTTAPPAPTASVPLASSLVTAQDTWAIADMGDTASDSNNFWQVFARPATGPGAGTWSLVTPPGVADNGGLVAAGSTTAVQIGFRPSQELVFTPLATSTDTGKNWTPGVLAAPLNLPGPSAAALADAPDALSLGPSGQELALLANGTIETATSATGAWTKLTSVSAIAISPAGRACGLTEVDAMSFWPNGFRVAAGSCEHSGVAGVFTETNGTWQLNGPKLAGAYGQDQVRVLRVNGTAAAGGPGKFSTALLSAGGSLFAAWYDGGRWTVSAPLPGTGASLRGSGFGPGGSAWMLLGDGRAEVISGPGGAWQALPAVPKGTAVLAAPAPSGKNTGYDALAVAGKVLTVWRLTGDTAGVWTKAQVITVPIAYGSSG